MSEVIFPDGINVYAKHDNAPAWAGDTIVIDKAKLIAWLSTQQNERVRLNVATSKGGKKYLKVDTWQAGQKPAGNATQDQSDGLPF